MSAIALLVSEVYSTGEALIGGGVARFDGTVNGGSVITVHAKIDGVELLAVDDTGDGGMLLDWRDTDGWRIVT
jgi:hypothetical protein